MALLKYKKANNNFMNDDVLGTHHSNKVVPQTGDGNFHSSILAGGKTPVMFLVCIDG